MQCPNCRTVIIKVNKITQTFFEGTSHLDPAATPFIGKTEHRCIDTINQETVFTHRIELTNPKAGPPIKFTIGTTAILRNYPHDWCSSARVTVDVELEPNTTRRAILVRNIMDRLTTIMGQTFSYESPINNEKYHWFLIYPTEPPSPPSYLQFMFQTPNAPTGPASASQAPVLRHWTPLIPTRALPDPPSKQPSASTNNS